MHEEFDVETAKRFTRLMNSLQPHAEMYCAEKNEYGKEHGKSFYVMPNGEYKCALCGTSVLSNEFKVEMGKTLKENKEHALKTFLRRKSMFRDRTLEAANFESYRTDLTDNEEVEVNKQKAIEIAQRINNGEIINSMITSETTGVGKSHLAMAILKAVNNGTRKVVFLEAATIYDKVQQSIRTGDEYTLEYFAKLSGESDVLVLDDLGAEIGDKDTDKIASDYINRLWRAIVDARQDKTTITTTNLRSVDIRRLYDVKVVSRLLNGAKSSDGIIVFNETKDLRPMIERQEKEMKDEFGF